MSISERFLRFIDEQNLCRRHERILLGVSGGKDSVLMVHLFAEAGFPIGIAHCNFRLRGADADADEAFVSALADRFEVPFYGISFDTQAHAREHGISIQMAARELRYDWFETIRASQGYDWIAVAHHRSDHVETLLLNLVRGTGLPGLRGMQPRRGRIIRPLLFLDAEEIMAYVREHGIAYRDDESNFSVKYARNKIRLEVIPRLKELNPDLEQTVAASMNRFADAHRVVQQYVGALRSRLIVPGGEGEWTLPLNKVMALDPRAFLLHELLRPFDFSEAVTADISRSLPGIPGAHFHSPTHRLYIDRGYLVLTRIRSAAVRGSVLITRPGEAVRWGDTVFETALTDDTTIADDRRVARLDAGQIVFPIEIRSWQEGDVFYPLGLGRRKKLSDFFVSIKMPLYRKPDVPVVVNGNGDILWVAPYRIDDRYKITGETKKVFTLACS